MPHGEGFAAEVSESFELVAPPEMHACQSSQGKCQERHPETAVHHAPCGKNAGNAGATSTMVVAAIALALFGDAVRLSPTGDETKTSRYAVFYIASVVYQYAVSECDVLAERVGERQTQRVVHRDVFADVTGTGAERQQEQQKGNPCFHSRVR